MVEKLVPKVRFNEFHGEWDTILLNSILSFKNGLNASKDQYGFGTKFINVSDILENNYLTYDNIQDYVNVNENELTNYIVEYGDIVFQRSSENREEVGTANVYLGSQPCVYGGFVIRGKKKGNYNPFFLKELLQSTRVRKEITSWSGGSTRYNIGQDSLNKISIILPSIEEQNKISDLLLRIYEKIELLEHKYQYYKNFKKYLMQQIFTQKLRFKDDENNSYQEWEHLHLKDIISLNGGYAFKSELFKDEGIPIIRISNISQDNSVILNDLVYYDKIKNDHDFIIKKGELIIAMSGATTGKVAVYDSEHISYINQRVGLFKQISNKLYYPFLVQYTLSDGFKKELQKTLVAGAQPNISKKEIESFKIDLPYYDEQKKIADLLTNIDLKINTIRKQTFEVSEFKKSLLQQMFI